MVKHLKLTYNKYRHLLLSDLQEIFDNFTTAVRRVVCAISGGVDSAVSALLLKQKGYDVTGVFMKNWDSRDELGHCASDRDRNDAQFVCDHLNIPLHDVDFIKQYWNHVFLYLLQEYEQGFTPNPDIYCNKFIKFNAFLRHSIENFDADAIATGHYARVGLSCDSGGDAKLLRAVDQSKDQTLFLSQMPQHALRRCMFPVGHMIKHDVKRIAVDAGLERIVRKKESMGICFIGKRDFKIFIEQYIKSKSGVFINIETDKIVGHHNGLHNYTLGQRCHIGGQAVAYFVAKMDVATQNIHVAPGTRHPSLFTHTFTTERPHWICQPPASFTAHSCFQSQFRFQHIHPLIDCDARVNHQNHDLLDVTLARPLRAITPGQFAVFYDGQECLGSARILRLGISLFESNDSGLEIRDEVTW